MLQHKLESYLAGIADTSLLTGSYRHSVAELRRLERIWTDFEPTEQSKVPFISLPLPDGICAARTFGNILVQLRKRSTLVCHQLSPKLLADRPVQWEVQVSIQIDQVLWLDVAQDLLVISEQM
jgi:hypothetical protein